MSENDVSGLFDTERRQDNASNDEPDKERLGELLFFECGQENELHEPRDARSQLPAQL